MVKADLITGFLGSGKTTFLRQYVQALLKTGEKICILENDYGAVNVDMMLLNDLKSDRLGLEMVAGGCDYDCHKRRFKTKLITIALLGYDRVIIEPSGIFDVDEFFDTMHEDELYDRYTIDNVLAIVNAHPEENMTEEARALFASQTACAGKIILSRTQECTDEEIDRTIAQINSCLAELSCHQVFRRNETVLCTPWNLLSEKDYESFSHSGYSERAYIKRFSMDDNGFRSLFFMNPLQDKDTLLSTIQNVMKDPSFGHIIRIKGFLQEKDGWIEINASADHIAVSPVSAGQHILIIIGEQLNEEKIDACFPAEFSTLHTQ